MKTCSVCRIAKELRKFNKDKYGKGGVRAQCKQCQYAVARKRYFAEHYKPQAKEIARVAYEKGELQKPLFCECCGQRRKLERHHPDYNKPLEIEWLCRRCHSHKHRSLKIA